MSRRSASYWGIVPLLISWLHLGLYHDYIVDDAAISIAYAHNLANGNGLVSQVGMAPVEAYSNSLWVYLWALAFSLGLENIYLIATLLGGICTVGAGYLIWRTLRGYEGINPLGIAVVLSVMASSSPLMRWVSSGLENGLYLLGCVGLWSVLGLGKSHAQRGWLVGGLAALLVFIRPDGLLFGGLGIIAYGWSDASSRRSLLTYLLGWIGGLLIFWLFRWGYFGEWWPTPFYSKQGQGWFNWDYGLKIHRLFRSVVGPFGGGLAVLMGVVTVWYRKSIFQDPRYRTLMFAWLISIAIFLMLPYDHLGWYRYATPFLTFQYLYGAALLGKLWQASRLPTWLHPRTIWGMLTTYVIAHIGMNVVVTKHHLEAPIVPFEPVAAVYGYQMNHFADSLQIGGAPMLIPDAGGAILTSQMEVHDIIGLLDPHLAKSMQTNLDAYRSYLLADLQPALIHLHDLWVQTFPLVADSSFQTAYLPIVLGREGDHVQEILYIRRQFVASQAKSLAEIQELWQACAVPVEVVKQDFQKAFP